MVSAGKLGPTQVFIEHGLCRAMSWPQGEQGTKSPRAVCAFAQAGDRVSESGMEEAGPMLTWALAGVWGIRESLLGEQLSRRDPRMAGVRRVSEAHQEEHF